MDWKRGCKAWPALFVRPCKATSVQWKNYECTTLDTRYSRSCYPNNSRHPTECLARALFGRGVYAELTKLSSCRLISLDPKKLIELFNVKNVFLFFTIYNSIKILCWNPTTTVYGHNESGRGPTTVKAKPTNYSIPIEKMVIGVISREFWSMKYYLLRNRTV